MFNFSIGVYDSVYFFLGNLAKFIVTLLLYSFTIYVTILLLHVKMMKSSFWIKNVLNFNTVHEICIDLLTK
ncbi:hypothetical protein EKA14_04970 [Bacillus mycoides]|nr:hypothetical protein EKA14_04970 [Bacillus mycoides]